MMLLDGVGSFGALSVSLYFLREIHIYFSLGHFHFLLRYRGFLVVPLLFTCSNQSIFWISNEFINKTWKGRNLTTLGVYKTRKAPKAKEKKDPQVELSLDFKFGQTQLSLSEYCQAFWFCYDIQVSVCFGLPSWEWLQISPLWNFM